MSRYPQIRILLFYFGSKSMKSARHCLQRRLVESYYPRPSRQSQAAISVHSKRLVSRFTKETLPGSPKACPRLLNCACTWALVKKKCHPPLGFPRVFREKLRRRSVIPSREVNSSLPVQSSRVFAQTQREQLGHSSASSKSNVSSDNARIKKSCTQDEFAVKFLPLRIPVACARIQRKSSLDHCWLTGYKLIPARRGFGRFHK